MVQIFRGSDHRNACKYRLHIEEIFLYLDRTSTSVIIFD